VSLGHCYCPCEEWEHGPVCTGGFERMLPKYPHQQGALGMPLCLPCYDAIYAVTDRGAITPPPAQA
jgi:hypothetical protein